MNLGPSAELTLLSRDLGKALKLFGFSRAFVGGVALIISILTRPNDQFRVTLGPNAMYSNHFSCMHERNVLQSLLVAGLSRHGLAPTPWHSSSTGPCNTPPGAFDTYPDTLPRPTDYPDPVPPRLAPSSQTQTIFPTLQNPPLARTEAQHRGLDILQILHALLDLGNPTENVPDHLSLSTGEIWALQHHHRTLIHDLRVFLPILFLTHQQRPYRAKLGPFWAVPSLLNFSPSAVIGPQHAQIRPIHNTSLTYGSLQSLALLGLLLWRPTGRTH